MIESMITDIISQITKWHGLVLLGVITLIGLGRLVQELFRMKNAASFGAEVREKFNILCDAIFEEEEEHFGAKGQESMNWLITNSHRIKMQMGSSYHGSYQPMNHVGIILQGLPKLQRYILLNRDGEYREDITMLAFEIDDTFARYIGALEYEGPRHLKKIINPFRWLPEGVAWVLSLPLLLLPLFGSQGAAKREKIMTGSRFQLVASLIGLVVNLITIISFVALWLHK